jgi:hypothetical protein
MISRLGQAFLAALGDVGAGGETVRAALEGPARRTGWLAGVIDASWQEVYGQRTDDFRLLDSKAMRAIRPCGTAGTAAGWPAPSRLVRLSKPARAGSAWLCSQARCRRGSGSYRQLRSEVDVPVDSVQPAVNHGL